MTLDRKLIRQYKPAGEPGFLGAGHIARPVIQVGYRESDPFILLMDDMLDKKDKEPAGGPHPHAGFETVTLLIEGELGDGKHQMKDGDLQQMTAGSGVIHTETIEKQARLRLLQLWLALPKKDRWTSPRVQDLRFGSVPVSSTETAVTRVYSGSFAGLKSPLLNYAKIIIADINIKPGAVYTQQLPAAFTTFMYVIDGDLIVGEDAKPLVKDEVGWLDRFDLDPGESTLTLEGGSKGARLILYAGEPQHDEIVSHGPFIGDTSEDIQRLYQEYRQQKMIHIHNVAPEQQIVY